MRQRARTCAQCARRPRASGVSNTRKAKRAATCANVRRRTYNMREDLEHQELQMHGRQNARRRARTCANTISIQTANFPRRTYTKLRLTCANQADDSKKPDPKRRRRPGALVAGDVLNCRGSTNVHRNICRQLNSHSATQIHFGLRRSQINSVFFRLLANSLTFFSFMTVLLSIIKFASPRL